MTKPISRDELRGISFLQLICLYVNRAGDLAIEPKQIKLDSVTRLEGGNVRVKISPERITGWTNGPIEVIIPPVEVDKVYDETVIDWQDIQGKTLEEVLKIAALPPPLPTRVEVEEYDMLYPGAELKLKYRLTYTNAFFVGETIVRISGAPNNLDSLAVLNTLFIRAEQ
jgi:hypothetical protein